MESHSRGNLARLEPESNSHGKSAHRRADKDLQSMSIDRSIQIACHFPFGSRPKATLIVGRRRARWTAQTFLDFPGAIIHGNEGDVYEQHAVYG